MISQADDLGARLRRIPDDPPVSRAAKVAEEIEAIAVDAICLLRQAEGEIAALTAELEAMDRKLAAAGVA